MLESLKAGFIVLIVIILFASCSNQSVNEMPQDDSFTKPTIADIYTDKSRRITEKVDSKSDSPANPDDIYIESLISTMSLDKKISQLFILDLNRTQKAPNPSLDAFIKETHAGGYVLFSGNITTVEATRQLTDYVKACAEIAPFICIDEEGGKVSRLSSAGLPGYTNKPSAASIGESGEIYNAYQAGASIGNMLQDLGVNVDFAPVADVLSNPKNTVIGNRSYGTDPDLVSDMASAFQAGLRSRGILTAPKHFPGHGSTSEDTHNGSAIIYHNTVDLYNVDYRPFIRLISEGAEFIMSGHLTAPQTEAGNTPATLSSYFMTDILRYELGFNGIIISDAMNMGAITENYTAAESAAAAIIAGVDMILMPEDYHAALDGIINAVNNGEITIERIHESLKRILKAKLRAGLLVQQIE